jgi:lipoyl-dependent peroxiredoxin
MAATRTASAHWEGSLLEGKGRVSLESSGVGSYDVSWPARTEEPNGVTSPEELIAAAHSTCYSMSLSNLLSKAGHTVETIDTSADVTFQPGQGITGIRLSTRGAVPGLSADEFADFAEQAKTACPVSAALTGTTITLDAALA